MTISKAVNMMRYSLTTKNISKEGENKMLEKILSTLEIEKGDKEIYFLEYLIENKSINMENDETIINSIAFILAPIIGTIILNENIFAKKIIVRSIFLHLFRLFEDFSSNSEKLEKMILDQARSEKTLKEKNSELINENSKLKEENLKLIDAIKNSCNSLSEIIRQNDNKEDEEMSKPIVKSLEDSAVGEVIFEFGLRSNPDSDDYITFKPRVNSDSEPDSEDIEANEPTHDEEMFYNVSFYNVSTTVRDNRYFGIRYLFNFRNNLTVSVLAGSSAFGYTEATYDVAILVSDEELLEDTKKLPEEIRGLFRDGHAAECSNEMVIQILKAIEGLEIDFALGQN